MSDLSLKFGADASGLLGGIDAAKTQIVVMQQTINVLQNNFTSLISVTEKQGEAFEKAGEGAEKGGSSFKKYMELAKGAGEVASKVIEGIGKIVEWGQKVGEQGEKIEKLGSKLGMSAGEIQRMGAAAEFAGGDLDKAGKASEGLNNAFAKAKGGAKEQADAFRQLGIDTTKSMNSTDLMAAASAKLGAMAEGPQKAALAQKIFGASAKESADLLTEMGQHAGEANAAIDKYGVVNEDAAQKAASLGSAFKDSKLAVDGIQNVLISAFAPALETAVRFVNDLIASFTKSYNEGGQVRQMMDALGVVFKVIETVLMALVPIFMAQWHLAMNLGKALVDLFMGAWNGMMKFVGGFSGLHDAVKSGLQPVLDVLGNIWDFIKKVAKAYFDFVSKIPGLGGIVRAEGKIISKTMQDVAKDAQFAAREIQHTWQTAADGPKGDGKADKPIKAQTAGAGRGGGRRSGARGGAVGGGGAGPSNGPTEAEKAEKAEELALAASLTNWNHTLDEKLQSEVRWSTKARQIEVDHWNAVLKAGGLSAKELAAVQDHLAKAEQALNVAKRADAKATEAQLIDAAKEAFEVSKDGIEKQKALVDDQLKHGRITAAQAIAQKAELERQLLEAERR